MIKDKLVSEIEIKLSSKPSDDFQLNREYIANVLDVTADVVKTELLNESVKYEKEIDNFYIERTDWLNLVKEDQSNHDVKRKRFYIEIPYEPLNLFNDKGIVRIVNNYQKECTLDSKNNIESIKHFKFSRPTINNIFFYREGRRLFAEGVGDEAITKFKFAVAYSPSEKGFRTDLDEEYPISSDVIEMLIERTYQKIIGSFSNNIEDNTNDNQ